MTEVLLASDAKKEIASLASKVNQYRTEVDMAQNRHVKTMFEGFKAETQNLLRQVQQAEDGVMQIEKRLEETRKDSNKHMQALVNEVEIMSAQIEKKAGLEELGARLE